MSEYESVIGLEIHSQIKTNSKMFCSCKNDSKPAEPNLNICPICTGMPGTLPSANKKAIEKTITLGLAIGAKVAPIFNFERKNYFYPDLPKAYQITSSSKPPIVGGCLIVDDGSGERKIRINHVHLEEDAGKLVHGGSSESFVDLNRAGTPLLEIVTEPDIRSAREASLFMQNLRSTLKHLDISDANMEEGNLRCDVNISMRKTGAKEYGTKVEVKNLNSFKSIEKAIDSEIKRQTDLIEKGEKIIQETRGWDDAKGKTTSQRSKEEAHDYRYFPEPDLPWVTILEDDSKSINVESLKEQMPESPAEKSQRFIEEYGITKTDAENLLENVALSTYFEKTLSHIDKTAEDFTSKREFAKKTANWILTELLGRMNTKKVDLDSLKVEPENMAELIISVESGRISGKMAKDIFDEMFETGKSAFGIIKEKGLEQIDDEGAIEEIVAEVIRENGKVVSEIAEGKNKAFGFLVGQVMQKTKGKANPKIVSELIKKNLKSK